MNRASVMVAAGEAMIETYVDGDKGGADVVVLPSYGRDGGPGASFRAAVREDRSILLPARAAGQSSS